MHCARDELGIPIATKVPSKVQRPRLPGGQHHLYQASSKRSPVAVGRCLQLLLCSNIEDEAFPLRLFLHLASTHVSPNAIISSCLLLPTNYSFLLPLSRVLNLQERSFPQPWFAYEPVKQASSSSQSNMNRSNSR